MKDLLDKISSYNLFNYLFPGVLFVVVIEKTTSYSLVQENIVIGVFFYYFIGLVISRIGSLVIEPVLIKSGFVKFAVYKDFVVSSKKDEKIGLLSEVNNMYRTLISLFIILLLIKPYEILEQICPDELQFVLISIMLLIFLLSYRKQIAYIKRRIECNKD